MSNQLLPAGLYCYPHHARVYWGGVWYLRYLFHFLSTPMALDSLQRISTLQPGKGTWRWSPDLLSWQHTEGSGFARQDSQMTASDHSTVIRPLFAQLVDDQLSDTQYQDKLRRIASIHNMNIITSHSLDTEFAFQQPKALIALPQASSDNLPHESCGVKWQINICESLKGPHPSPLSPASPGNVPTNCPSSPGSPSHRFATRVAVNVWLLIGNDEPQIVPERKGVSQLVFCLQSYARSICRLAFCLHVTQK
ncbi:hypothetical protein ACRALDRAFT_206425 [Sodiomyces alcalophilus JCM 7366]|uniref:uncharacterized protein n=1 Tax=Sodiomyces alcalophilus JCM 7366 TaxID=591952 RepID=UPI0039B6A47A